MVFSGWGGFSRVFRFIGFSVSGGCCFRGGGAGFCLCFLIFSLGVGSWCFYFGGGFYILFFDLGERSRVLKCVIDI